MPQVSSEALGKKQVFLKMSQERGGNLVVSEEELIRLIDSLNQLNIRYRDLLELIDDDPELKKMVEEKLEKNLRSKLKL